MQSLKKAICIASVLVLGTVAASAADLSGQYDGSMKDGGAYGYWVVDLGGFGVAEPDFKGSKDYRGAFQFYGDIYRAGGPVPVSLPNDAFGVTLFRTDRFRAGIAADYEDGRHPSDDRPALNGLHIIDTTAQFGGFAEYFFTPAFRTRVELLQGVSGNDGLLVNLMADYIYRPSPLWQLTIGPRLAVVDSQYNNSNYGITPIDSALSGLPRYHAGGGLESVGVEATAKYSLTDRWSLRGFFEYNKLLDDASDSPLVTQRGSDDQVRVGLGASYAFKVPYSTLPSFAH